MQEQTTTVEKVQEGVADACLGTSRARIRLPRKEIGKAPNMPRPMPANGFQPKSTVLRHTAKAQNKAVA